MFKKKKFLAYLTENGITVSEIAQLLGISKTTLYRKMNGESDFYRNEILKIATIIPSSVVNDIFFDEKVACTQQ